MLNNKLTIQFNVNVMVFFHLFKFKHCSAMLEKQLQVSYLILFPIPVVTERDAMAKVSSPFIVKLFYSLQSQHNIFLVTFLIP